MKTSEYNIKTGTCRSNYSTDPWRELEAINKEAIKANMLEAYAEINKRQKVKRKDLIM